MEALTTTWDLYENMGGPPPFGEIPYITPPDLRVGGVGGTVGGLGESYPLPPQLPGLEWVYQ